MTSLESVSAHVPEHRVPVGDFLRALGFDETRVRVHERYFGFAAIRLEPGAPWVDQALAAVAGLPAPSVLRHRVRYVLQARTMPVAAPYPDAPLQQVVRALGLTRATAFCVTQQACASALFAVDLAGRLLAADGVPDALALVLTGEKAFSTQEQVIADTGVMGETTAAVLVGTRGERDRVLGYASRSRGEHNPGGLSMAETSALMRDSYPDELAAVVLAALDQAGLRPADVDLVLPHHANRLSWQRFAKRVGLADCDRIFLDTLPEVGHCFGADSFLNYRAVRDRGRLRPGDHYVMTAVGVGANFATAGLGTTFSAMVFQH